MRVDGCGSDRFELKSEVARGMRGKAGLAVWLAVLSGMAWAQDAAKPATAQGKSAVIGCLSGPDSDDHYTLTSMQHRMGLEVVGGDDLKKASGFKVKLTGSWEALPGSEGKTGDAARRFKASDVDVMEEKCQAPQAMTPLSKKKQEQQRQQQQQQPKQ